MIAGALRAGTRAAGLGLDLFWAAGVFAVSGKRPLERARALHHVTQQMARTQGIVVRSSGRIPAGPVLLLANHVTYLDPIAITAALPCLPVAKAEVAKWPLIGTLARQAGVHFVQRERAQSRAGALRAMVRTLRGGASVLNFPEGTTTEGAAVLPLQPGSLAAARMAQVRIVPVAISWDPPEVSWTGEASFVPHYLRTAARPTLHANLRWGEPLMPTSLVSDAELSRRVHRFLYQSVQEMTQDAAA
jgi:1-acyl-sn-glycerol-3-phosphate acyltransferase